MIVPPQLSHISHSFQPLLCCPPLHEHISTVDSLPNLGHHNKPSLDQILRQLDKQPIATLGNKHVHRQGEPLLVLRDVAVHADLADRENTVRAFSKDTHAIGPKAKRRRRCATVLVARILICA